MDYGDANRYIADRVTYTLSCRGPSTLTRDKKDIILSGWTGYELMRWKPDKSVVISPSCNATWSLRNIVNSYNPFNYNFWLYTFRRVLIVGSPPESHDLRHVINNGRVIKDSLVIKPDGSVNPGQLGSFEELKKKVKQEDYLRDKPRRRGRYWVKKARGVSFNRSACTERSWNCSTRGWNRTWPTVNTTYPCGCIAIMVPYKFKGTVESIMNEANATVRTAMIKMYGIDKFFKDAKSETMDKYKNYSLLQLQMGSILDGNNQILRALRMKCPSTGQVYINGVPPQTSTVGAALDWIYNTRDYLGTVGNQT